MACLQSSANLINQIIQSGLHHPIQPEGGGCGRTEERGRGIYSTLLYSMKKVGSQPSTCHGGREVTCRVLPSQHLGAALHDDYCHQDTTL